MPVRPRFRAMQRRAPGSGCRACGATSAPLLHDGIPAPSRSRRRTCSRPWCARSRPSPAASCGAASTWSRGSLRRLPGLPLQPVCLLRGRPGLVSGAEGDDLPPPSPGRLPRSRRAAGSGSTWGWAGPGAAGRSREPRARDPRRAHRGTNGKGSVVALVGACLAAAGYRSGRPPSRTWSATRADPGRRSPDLRGRLRRPRARRAPGRRSRRSSPRPTDRVRAADRARPPPLRDEDVDLAVVEVGLGGRLDATHAWDGGSPPSRTSTSTT